MDFSVRSDNRALLCRIPFNNGEECRYFTEAGLQPLSPLHEIEEKIHSISPGVTGNQYLLLLRARAGQVPGPVTKRQSLLSRSWQLSEKTDKLGEPQRSAQTTRKPALPFWGLEEMLVSQLHEPEGCLCPSQWLLSTIHRVTPSQPRAVTSMGQCLFKLFYLKLLQNMIVIVLAHWIVTHSFGVIHFCFNMVLLAHIQECPLSLCCLMMDDWQDQGTLVEGEQAGDKRESWGLLCP